MSNIIEFFVAGKPAPKGSSRGFIRGGKVVITSANRNLAAWRDLTANQAQQYKPTQLLRGAIHMELRFYLPPPRNKKKSVILHTKRPDIDKLIRAIFDALKSVIYVDDAQICCISSGKMYADALFPPGVNIRITEAMT